MKKTFIAATLGLLFTASAFADNSVVEINQAKEQALVEIKQAKEEALLAIKGTHSLEEKVVEEKVVEDKVEKTSMTAEEFSDFVNPKFTNYGGVKVIRSLEEYGLSGFYEVKLGGRDAGVMNSTGEFFILGNVIQFVNGTHKNLTAEYENKALSENAAKAIEQIPDDNMVTYSPEGEKVGTAYVFTDTTCGYCRKLHSELDQLLEGGVEVKYIPYPRAGFNPEVPVGRNKDGSLKMGKNQGLVDLSQVFCAEDKQQALTDIKNGVAGDKYNTEAYKEGMTSCNKKVEVGYTIGQTVGFSGTPFIYLSNGNAIPGYNPAPQIIKNLQDNK
jgi:thiol:disulfide interchange protein DsbC